MPLYFVILPLIFFTMTIALTPTWCVHDAEKGLRPRPNVNYHKDSKDICIVYHMPYLDLFKLDVLV